MKWAIDRLFQYADYSILDRSHVNITINSVFAELDKENLENKKKGTITDIFQLFCLNIHIIENKLEMNTYLCIHLFIYFYLTLSALKWVDSWNDRIHCLGSLWHLKNRRSSWKEYGSAATSILCKWWPWIPGWLMFA